MSHLESLSSITVYGDGVMDPLERRQVLPPASSDSQSMTLMGRVNSRISESGGLPVFVSAKSAIAQAGVDIVETQYHNSQLLATIVNCGPYWQSYVEGMFLNLGAIYTLENRQNSTSDVKAYLGVLRDHNPWMTNKNTRLLHQEIPYIWIETSTMHAPFKDPSNLDPLPMHRVPRGSKRAEIADFLYREPIAHATDRSFPCHVVSGNTAYSILETPHSVQPIPGMALLIAGFAVLDHGKVYTRLVHGESRLVAQPDNTEAKGRDKHGIIAEIHSSPNSIIKSWQEGMKVGFMATPVYLDVALN